MKPTTPSNATEVFLAALLLTLFGILGVFSSSSIPAYHNWGDAYFIIKKQVFFAGFGFFLILLIQIIPIKLIEKLPLPLFGLSLFLLLLTLTPWLAVSVKGASRWVNLGPINFQPAELAKLALVFFLAKNLARKNTDLKKLSSILPNLIAFSLLALPLMLQPDFGTTVLLFLILATLLFIKGLPWRYVFSGIFMGLLAIGIAIYSAPYRMNRLLSFLDPWKEVKGGGFQIIQSYLSFQNGGLFGLGAGESRQRLYFLPEAHTDFIAAVIGEEYGLIGVVFVLMGYLIIFFNGLTIAAKQKSPFLKLLSLGILTLIACQALINLGVAMGLLPTKGISLPFLSSGASSLVVFLLAVGLLIRLDREVPALENRKVP